MKKSSKRKKRPRARAQPAGQGAAAARGMPATAQTIAKLRPDPLWALARRGLLSPEEIQAAWDIRAAFEIVTGPLRLRIASLEKIDCGGMEHLETHRVLRLLKRYNAWVDDMTRQRMAVGPVLDVVVESMSCREVDRRRRLRKGTTGEYLRHALDRYCKSVGWTR